jgi:lysophospholipase L1-like esterase
MWYYAVIAVLVILLGLTLHFCVIKRRKDSIAQFASFIESVYSDRVEWFKTLNKYVIERPSVFVGDSLTNEYLLAEIFNDYNVCNRGIGGDTTEGVLKRMDVSIYDLNPKQMFLLIGGNDFQLNKSPIELVIKNIGEICENAIRTVPDMEVYIISLYPILKDIIFGNKKSKQNIDPDKVITETNRQIQNLCDTKGYIYLDIYRLLVGEDASIKEEYTRDGMHLSPLGYEIVSKELLRYLTERKK